MGFPYRLNTRHPIQLWVWFERKPPHQGNVGGSRSMSVIRRTFGPARVFIDTDSIRMGDAWPDRIDRALESATVFLPVLGPSWLKIVDDYGRRRLDRPDDWECGEIRHALESRLPIIPLLLSHTPMPPREPFRKVLGISHASKHLNCVTVVGRTISQLFSKDWMNWDLSERQMRRFAIQSPCYP